MPTNAENLMSVFSDIADAIREKGGSGTMTPIQMPQKILDAIGTQGTITPSNTLTSVFSGIADAIRLAGGYSETIIPAEMAQKILDISTGYWGLKFTAQQAGSTIHLDFGTSQTTLPAIAYSLNDGETWNTYTFSSNVGTTITLQNIGDSVCFAAPEGITNTIFSQGNRTNNSGCFKATGLISASGDISSLLKNDESTARYLTLPNNCFARLFEGCTSLTTPPDLQATQLSTQCYQYMFRNCTSLTQAPALPSTSLVNQCYYFMFYGCTSLATAPILPATTLAASCYVGMFYNCTSLTTAPILLATSFGSLSSCYNQMFRGCSNLQEIQVHLTSWDGTGGSGWTTNWVDGVASNGTFKCPAALGTQSTITRGADKCPTGWTVVNI